MHTDEHSLFLFAHPDDEVAAAPQITLECSRGRVVHCAYLTDGAAKGVSADTRCKETLNVLHDLGAGRIDVRFIGAERSIGDGKLIENLVPALQSLLAWIDTWSGPPRHLFFLAWEGGHHDHDAVHAIGLQLSSRYDVGDVWQFPLYNGYGTRGRFFRVMTPLPTWGRAAVLRLSIVEGWRYALLCTRYASQWRTWMGLSPGVFSTYLLRRHHRMFPVDARAIETPPHEGGLLYERMFGARSGEVLRNIDALRGSDAAKSLF